MYKHFYETVSNCVPLPSVYMTGGAATSNILLFADRSRSKNEGPRFSRSPNTRF